MNKSHYIVSCYQEDCKVADNILLYDDLNQAKQNAETLHKDYQRIEISEAFYTEEGVIDWLIESYDK